jgi:hypothetical protein
MENKCPCCDGTGLVTTDFVDDFSSCMSCNGTGGPSMTSPGDYVPFATFGNDELAGKPVLGTHVRCRTCGERHEVEYGKKKDNVTGQMVDTKDLAFYKCTKNGKLYLCGIDGREI